ncbi:acyltransferase [Pseudoalteromonas sp. SWN29]|uniref:acyltransferase n=1 Tax=Pseudoalteromonas sp. SWN29 TaxID=2792064 RepID=UPI0018CD38B7|nr:acyltransferase [Pseudoalteromonas sp. SWN29]MBH0025403.1 acyltransferase [Pseudoalteromonas sp. SWN29]
MAIYTEQQLLDLGFLSVGKNVRISTKASLYGVGLISIGNNVRIDDFCVLSAGEGGITIGSHVHIAVYSSLIGAGKIIISDFCNISSRVAIYSSSDDYSGEYLTNPTINSQFTNVEHGPVTLNKHVIIGCGSVVLPNVNIAEGVAIGALALVNRDLQAWGIYAGQPAKYIKPRSKDLLNLVPTFLNYYNSKQQ